jgi:hypothetical protein
MFRWRTAGVQVIRDPIPVSIAHVCRTGRDTVSMALTVYGC